MGPTSGSSSSRGSTTSTTSTSWRAASRRSGCSQRKGRSTAPSGSTKSDTTIRTPGRRCRASRAFNAEARSAEVAVAWSGRASGAERDRPRPPPGAPGRPARARKAARRGESGGDHVSPPVVRCATPIWLPGWSLSSPTTPVTQAASSPFSTSTVPKSMRGGLVDQDPGLDLVLGQRAPHVRLARAGGHVPVDPAYVVLAGAVADDLLGLAARHPVLGLSCSP